MTSCSPGTASSCIGERLADHRTRRRCPPAGGTARNRLHLPESFRLHDWRASKITHDLDNHENPVEVSANARHHSPGYTMARYGRRRAEGAKKLAASSAARIGLSSLV
ncbi:hypothetical protein [Streptomyces katsurahamanus]|uniref:hypothetical protein n=1 Tax=Streptomyces katsurahamanus TaxID=2577098 RepID=UPI00129546BF|nr:hypothetical protein [Streptomyces katsurahamanus]